MDPQLIHGRWFRSVFHQVRVAMKAVMQVGGLGVAAFARHQQLLLAQEREQGITVAGQALLPQQRHDFRLQLARAQARQLRAQGPHLR